MKYISMLNEVVNNIQDMCNYTLTDIQLEIIKQAIASYGLACLMDSDIAEEARQSCCSKEQ